MPKSFLAFDYLRDIMSFIPDILAETMENLPTIRADREDIGHRSNVVDLAAHRLMKVLAISEGSEVALPDDQALEAEAAHQLSHGTAGEVVKLAEIRDQREIERIAELSRIARSEAA